jgi:osmotically-inducible protein OsmY
VSVADGTVHVTGFVGSVAQKLRAEEDAWVAGVNMVDDSGLTVDSFALNDQRRVSDAPFKTDAEIAKAVRDAFLIDPRLKTFVPKVAVGEGEVTLSGTVDSRQTRRAAEADAKDTMGVWRVRDTVVVQPAGNPTDVDIEAGSKRVLAEDPLLSDGKSIQVSTVKGAVALSGTITSGFERLEAIDDVETVPGVSEVDDSLAVKLPPADIKGNIEDRSVLGSHGRARSRHRRRGTRRRGDPDRHPEWLERDQGIRRGCGPGRGHAGRQPAQAEGASRGRGALTRPTRRAGAARDGRSLR